MRLKYLMLMFMAVYLFGVTSLVEADEVIPNWVAGFINEKDTAVPDSNTIKYQAYIINEPVDTTTTAYNKNGLDSENNKTSSWQINLEDFNAIGKTWKVGDTLVVIFTKIANGERNQYTYVIKDPNIAGNPQFPELAAALPVEMVSFKALARDQGWGYEVVLEWKTASETNNLGFEVLRSLNGVSFEKVGFISGSGSTTASQAYSYTDKNVTTGRYFYQLKQLDTDGTSKATDILEVRLAAPERYELGQNFPNPFNPTTEIMFKVKEEGKVQIQVFDILGRQVATLVDTHLAAGIHKVNFDGRALPSGMYLYMMKSAQYHEVKKMALIK